MPYDVKQKLDLLVNEKLRDNKSVITIYLYALHVHRRPRAK